MSRKSDLDARTRFYSYPKYLGLSGVLLLIGSLLIEFFTGSESYLYIMIRIAGFLSIFCSCWLIKQSRVAKK